MKTARLLLIMQLLLFASCGKDDKNSEYIEDNKQPKQETKEEVKKDTGKDTSSFLLDSSRQKNTGSKDKPSFQNEKPVAVISPLEAMDYNGKTVTVKGFVADIYQSEKVAYLNFVEKFPNNPFTAVIFAREFSDFPEIEKYRNKDVEVTGRVSMYKGKPQIILNNPSQIKLKN